MLPHFFGLQAKASLHPSFHCQTLTKNQYDLFYSFSKTIIIIQSNALLPFYPTPSKIILPELPSHVIAAVPYFEDLNIPSRIASTKLDMPGWYEGDLSEMLIKKYKNTFFI